MGVFDHFAAGAEGPFRSRQAAMTLISADCIRGQLEAHLVVAFAGRAVAIASCFGAGDFHQAFADRGRAIEVPSRWSFVNRIGLHDRKMKSRAILQSGLR